MKNKRKRRPKTKKTTRLVNIEISDSDESSKAAVSAQNQSTLPARDQSAQAPNQKKRDPRARGKHSPRPCAGDPVR